MNGKPRPSPRPVDAPGEIVPLAGRTTRSRRGLTVVREVSLALAVYGMAGWIYVGLCALVAPTTLALPLTHLTPWLREDTAGVLSFIVSFLGFVSYRLTSRS
jgi:hypothetical protein